MSLSSDRNTALHAVQGVRIRVSDGSNRGVTVMTKMKWALVLFGLIVGTLFHIPFEVLTVAGAGVEITVRLEHIAFMLAIVSTFVVIFRPRRTRGDYDFGPAFMWLLDCVCLFGGLLAGLLIGWLFF